MNKAQLMEISPFQSVKIPPFVSADLQMSYFFFTTFKISTNVVTVNARYPTNPLADIEYYIYNITANGRVMPLVFEIDPKTGVVSTSANLDREAGAEEYELDIIALTLATVTPQTSTCKVGSSIINFFLLFFLNNKIESNLTVR